MSVFATFQDPLAASQTSSEPRQYKRCCPEHSLLRPQLQRCPEAQWLKLWPNLLPESGSKPDVADRTMLNRCNRVELGIWFQSDPGYFGECYFALGLQRSLMDILCTKLQKPQRNLTRNTASTLPLSSSPSPYQCRHTMLVHQKQPRLPPPALC